MVDEDRPPHRRRLHTSGSSTGPTRTRACSQYLPLLELATKEEPDLPRHAFYLGREFFFHDRFADARASCSAIWTWGLSTAGKTAPAGG